MAEKLRDLRQPIDVPFLDATVAAVYGTGSKEEVTQFVSGLFDSKNELPTFKDHIRDFLVQSKEFSAQDKKDVDYNVILQDNKDLYTEETAARRGRERQRMLSIPGLIAPNELQDEMVDS